MDYKEFDKIKIGLASPDQIRAWSYGEVKKPETINYRTLKPERDGLFCERIFGPQKDWECHCGKYKRIRYKGKVCERCGVEVTRAKVRRERMGSIELAAPVSHIWYFKGIPSRIGLMLDITPKALEQVLYFSQYIVTDPGNTPLEKKQLLNEKMYNDMREKYEDDFQAEMGAEAIQKLLAEIDLDEMSASLRKELEDATGQKRVRLLKRLEVADSFRLSGNRPEWMILNVIPVIPPELRPMVQLDGGRFATSDLNDLYRRVINRNNRLQKLLELGAPNIIVRNEKRMLQEAVDALIDNGRRGRPVTGPNNRPLKSLSDMLKGKQGRFRQNLLGKRVDYSGRSVIVVGPELKMYQCGLPKEMALELFKPFVMKRLVETEQTNNIKTARKMVERARDEVWDALEVVIKEHPVLLNRAPTLHRLGIQAFEPVLVEGRAIKLHPLVCTAFNADFDGDQMAVHVPLSAEAQAEARVLMLAANNLLKPSDGRPVVVPTQDMVLGSYYLTIVKPEEQGSGNAYCSRDEAIMAYECGALGLHAPIKVRMTGTDAQGNPIKRLIETTVGFIIFNDAVPQDLGFIDRTVEGHELDLEISAFGTKGDKLKASPSDANDGRYIHKVGKKQLGIIIDECIKKHGTTKTAEVLDRIKAQGYKYSTIGAITVAVADAVIPPKKKELLVNADEKVDEIFRKYRRGYITKEERTRLVLSVWDKTTGSVSDALKDNLDEFNPIYMMADSGARGSMNQIRQLAGMRGLIANTSGKTIEIPIRANYREGLNVLEYFISSRGARKGLADTALRTADSGYLTRRLVDVSQDVIIREEDCGSDMGIEVYDLKQSANDTEPIEPLKERLVGRFLINDLIDENTGELIMSKDEMMTEADANRIIAAGIERVKIRSVLNCRSKHGVCRRCYGANLANGKLVSIGEAVGIIAAQSIGEPGTQLTMRTFHTGGIASAEDITQGLPRVEELFEARKPKRSGFISEIDGVVRIQEVKKYREIVVTNEEEADERKYAIPFGYHIIVNDGDRIRKGDQMTEGSLYPQDVLAVKGIEAVQDYIIAQVQLVYRSQAVEINDKHIEVIVRQMMRKVKVEEQGSTEMIAGSTVERSDFYNENKQICERIAAGEELTAPKSTPILLGITKASLATDSFLSAASFQETTRVLTDAAIKGKVDPLLGLKENVIIGNLVPAGTGICDMSDLPDDDATTIGSEVGDLMLAEEEDESPEDINIPEKDSAIKKALEAAGLFTIADDDDEDDADEETAEDAE
ncbi:MAG: DNA-directed RNA polymerase subunit beta' [Clostridia bacterium]|nr:DNA-directed RNA polymerase subunit beta' [Clostridia bacterium]